MKGKIVAMVIVLLTVVSSFGAVGTNTEKKVGNDCGCGNSGGGQTAYQDNRCGFVKPDNWQVNAKFADIQPSGTLPSSFDWRNEVDGGLPPCKDQGQCGSCWAFGTVGPLECNIKIKDNEIVDLSEQWLLSCNPDGYDCSGGFFVYDMFKNDGAVMEDDFKYQGNDQITCGTDGPYNHVYKIDDWAYVSDGGGIPTDDQMKQAIMDYGPIAVGVYCDSVQWEWHSVWDPNGVYTLDSDNPTNHVVVLVGWDDAGGYWILRNSWGTGFCNQGYMKFAYGICSIGDCASFVVYSGCDLTNKTKNGNEYYWSAGDVYIGNDYAILSPGGTSDGSIAYEIKIDNPNNYKVEDLWVGIQFKDTSSWPTNDGPDFYVQKSNGDWLTLEEGMGKPGVYTYTWRVASNPEEYICSDGYVRIKVHAAWDDCTYVRSAGIKYSLHTPVPDLDASCSPNPLSWTEVEKSGTRTGTITVTNIGESGSKLDWKVVDGYPSWITCSKTSGNDLPKGSTDSITLTVHASEQGQETRSGTIKIVNSEDSNDYKTFTVSIITKKGRSRALFFDFSELLKIRLPWLFAFLQQIRLQKI